MSIVSTTLPNDGEDIDASDISIPILAILAVLNGNIDSDNIAAGSLAWSLMQATGSATLTNLTVTGALTVSGTPTTNGWAALGQTPNTVTPSTSVPNVYDLVFNAVDLTSTVSPGMKLQSARTVAAPSKCTSLNGTTQYYTKSAPAGMTFTDDFTVSAWIKLSSYQAGTIASRYNGTSGWAFEVLASGQLQIVGYNAGSGNASYAISSAIIPLNKWVHVTAQLDMSTFTATTTTTYMMFDAIDVPITVGRQGTNPTALVQAGNLEIGSQNAGTKFFAGKIAQVAIYNAKVTQATIRAAKNQTIAGNETSLISAYSFNNTVNDLNTTNANNLTAQASAVATNADSPFANGVAAGSLDYAEILNTVFSTNTTITVRVPAGCQIPTSGGISTVNYSSADNPYGWPNITDVLGIAYIGADFTSTSVGTDVDVAGLVFSIYVPAGGRMVELTMWAQRTLTSATGQNVGLKIIENGQTVSEADNSTGSNVNAQAICSAKFFASAGLHTYKGSINQGGAGTMRMGGNPAFPGYLSAELV